MKYNMNSDTKKLELIEKLLTVSDEAVLAAVDAVLINSEKPVGKKRSFKDFAGAIADKELSELELAIEQGCEQINPDDWK